MNIYLIIILALMLLNYLLGLVTDVLNLRHVTTEIPEEFKDWYDEEKYAASQRYLRDNTRFDRLSHTVTVPITIGFILLGGFAWVNQIAASAGFGIILTGLLFTGILVLLSQLLQLPFSIYHTFVLEERYGFNKTTPKTFVADLLKGLALGIAIGGPILAVVIWFFDRFEWAWLYSWIALTFIQLIIMYLAPAYIMPLFNKFTPLEDGELRQAIEDYAARYRFSLKGIFKIDGSRRSTKSNAYFTGFGRWKRIALYDTLIEKHTTDELVSVLAHEVGHYKLRHIHKMLITSVLTTGLMFFILSLFISQPGLYEAFQVEGTPVYAGLVFFGFLFTPISLVISIFQNRASRKHEFEADAYAAETAGKPLAMIDALKKLSVDNLSNLTPHPLLVFLEYSHPPVLKRIEALRSQQAV